VFRWTIEHANAVRQNNPEAFKLMLTDAQLFKEFLENEKFLLDSIGMPSEYTTLLLDGFREAVDDVVEGHADPELVFRSLVQLHFHLRQANEETAQRAHASSWGKTAGGLLLGATGLLVTGLNVSALAATLGLGAVGSAVSAAFGGMLIAQVQPLISKDVCVQRTRLGGAPR
jgi:hypothetical protein